MLLLLEPPHFGKGHDDQNPHNPVREFPSQFGGKIRVAPIVFGPPQDSSQIHLVGVLGRKPTAHMNELEIRAYQTIGIQAGGLAAFFAHLHRVGFLWQCCCGGSIVGIHRVASLVPEVLVRAVVADEFSAHGVGKDIGTAIVLTRDATAAVFSAAVQFAPKGAPALRQQCRGQDTSWLRSAAVHVVGEAGIAKGHVVAFLAP